MKKFFKILKNPFAIIEDKKLLIFGICSFIIGIFMAYYFQVQLQILRINPLKELSIAEVFIGHSVIIVALTLVYFILGKIINKKTRLLDILNSVLISFTPVYLLVVQNINGYLYNEINSIEEVIKMKSNNIRAIEPPFLLLIISVLSILFLVYFIYLLFTGFRTATNSKKVWHYILFFTLLIITDLLCSGLINSI